jgi:hypothetical protein
MLNERLQILVTSDQRRRLQREARRRGTSVGSVVRDAVDAQLGSVTPEDRRAAFDRILAMRGRFASPEDATPEGINRMAASEKDELADEIARAIKR